MARFYLLPNRFLLWSALAAILVWVSIAPKSGMAASPDPFPTWRLQARVVALGLPGVAGVRQVGRFHSGGPIPGNPEFLLSTGAGRMLDPARLLVAVTSNFGAPLEGPLPHSRRHARRRGKAVHAHLVAPLEARVVVVIKTTFSEHLWKLRIWRW